MSRKLRHAEALCREMVSMNGFPMWASAADAIHKAAELLDLIAAEFDSDPMSVQCFDLRIVERVKEIARDV